MTSRFLILVMACLPRLLLGACKVMQFPLLFGCLLRPARSIWSVGGSVAYIGLFESSLAGLGLPAIANGGCGVAILRLPQISSIIAPGSMETSESTLPVFSFLGGFLSPGTRSCCFVDHGFLFLPVPWSEVFNQFGGTFEFLDYVSCVSLVFGVL